jgi:Zn-dependent protease
LSAPPAQASAAVLCPECGSELGRTLLTCPGCGRLVHAERLRALASEAETATARDDVAAALVAWRSALELLPAGSRQHEAVSGKVTALSRRVDAALPSGAPDAPAPGSVWARWLAPLGAVGLLAWKFKFVVVFVLTKAKLLLLGLTKMPTLVSALASFGVYWTAWGWKFALGLIASMYVHEMGHVFALSRYGIRATAPMFVPGLGAFVRMEQYPAEPREDARVGLAGPIWGLYAAVAAWMVAVATGWAAWAAIARSAALLNLFNLVPLGPLDGGRGFRSLSRGQRWTAVAALAVTWWATHEGLLILLLVAATARAAMGGEGHAPGDRGSLLRYVGVVAALAALTRTPV